MVDRVKQIVRIHRPKQALPEHIGTNLMAQAGKLTLFCVCGERERMTGIWDNMNRVIDDVEAFRELHTECGSLTQGMEE
jgi:hypothetical protein